MGRRANGTFEPGHVANPGGRPKVAGKVRELARGHGPDAIARLVELMGDEDGRVAVAACRELLDRGYGRPHQSVTKTVKHVRKNPRELSLEELEKRLTELTQGAVQ